MLELVRAVKALVLDAEMRCALDERELEFMWAAPSKIYGAHGWRDNNGSVSERTPYPSGNFKVAVRHGAEGNARELLARRRRLIGAISLGQRQLDAVDADAMGAGSGGGGVPIRLPSVDEFKRRALTNSSGSTVLEPARAILDATGTGELREFAPMPPPGRPSPPGRPRSREQSFAD